MYFPVDAIISVRSGGWTNSLHDIEVGDLVLIKNFQGGYLYDNDGGTVSVSPSYNSDDRIWEVEAGYDPWNDGQKFKFKNVETGNYWKSGNNNDNCLAGTVSGFGDAATWESAGIVENNADGFDYRRRYIRLRNY